jgi:hypothetical protein
MFRYGCLVPLIPVLVLGASSCVLHETRHDWYLAPDGAVTWSVLEVGGRSDAAGAADRQKEETSYISDVKSGSSPIARGLTLVGAAGVRTTVLRGSAPFTVLTEGHFTDIATLGRGLLDPLGLVGTSVLERGQDTTTWTMTMRDPETGSDADVDAVQALTADIDHLDIFLVDGHFTAAEHFTISPDGRMATIGLDASVCGALDNGQVVTFKLTWGKHARR